MAVAKRLETMNSKELKAFTEFVDWFFNTYESTAFEKGGAHLPCPKWWEHPEAVERLYTLHCLDAALKDGDGDGFDNFWRDVDHHTTYLFGSSSPFRNCNFQVHRESLVLSSQVEGRQLGADAYSALRSSSEADYL